MLKAVLISCMLVLYNLGQSVSGDLIPFLVVILGSNYWKTPSENWYAVG